MQGNRARSRYRRMNRIANSTASAGIATVLLQPLGAWAQQGPSNAPGYAYGYHMMDWGGGWYGMMFAPLFMILLVAIVIAVAVLLVRWLSGPSHGVGHHPGSSPRAPLDILKERFARGEIDKEEFEERRRVLGD